MLPAPLLRQLRRLILRSRRAARERLAGAYESAVRGAGLVFTDVRQYQPGDDVRRIDWNVTARTGTPHVKQFVEERERTVWLLVDGSASQHFRRKRQTAVEVAALVAFAAGLHGDRVGLVQFTDRVEQLLPPAKGDRAARRIVRELFAFQPQHPGTSLAAALAALRRKRRAVVFLVSDFRSSKKVSGTFSVSEKVPDTFFERAIRIAARRHDLIAVTVADPAEAELPNVGLVRLQDDEAGGQLLLNTSDPRVRIAYSQQAAGRETALRDLLAAAGVDRVAVTTAGGHLNALVAAFRRRERRR